MTCTVKITSFLAVFLQQCLCNETQPVVFLEEPRNTCILEGEDAYLPCVYTGTSTLPHWTINGNVYSTNRLPAPYYYNGTGLVVNGATSSQNRTTYTCLIQVQTSEGVRIISSVTATLTVLTLPSTSSGIKTSIIIIVGILELIYSMALSSSL